MKVLIVCSKNSGHIAPFILEQAKAVEQTGVEIEFYSVEGKGFWGYLKNRKAMLAKIKTFQPALIHAHYGLSGLLANTQRRIPVVTTYHGSDINNKKVYPFSRLNMILSAHNIFVSKNITPIPIAPDSYRDGIPKPLSSAIGRILSPTGERQRKNSFRDLRRVKQSLIPCGINTLLFIPGDKQNARKALGMDTAKKYILFAGAFHVNVKNPVLAKAAVALLPNVELIELNGYRREQVVLILHAVNVVLMTSFTEGSPQIIKEALACNCPVVSVPVGDVPSTIEDIPGCYITSYEPDDIAVKLQLALDFGRLTEGRKRIETLGLDAESVAGRILEVYKEVLSL